VLDELATSGITLPPHIFHAEPSSYLNASSTRHERARRPARPGRVEPPTEEMYEILSQRRRDGK
jgi:hypothetical protein